MNAATFWLQEEVDRLRNKLESVVSSVENVIQDAQIAQVCGVSYC